jgi:excisionase family DNA binding protein
VAIGTDEWLSLGEASARLGIHPNTMRRWADGGKVPCYRTPGGHRRFRAADLQVVLADHAMPPLPPAAETLVQRVVVYTRQRLAARPVRDGPWQAAFAGAEERQQMRDMGQRLLSLAVAAMRGWEEPVHVLAEGCRIGTWYGEQCAQYHVSLSDTARSFCFFRTSVLQAASQREDVTDAEQVRAHTQLAGFLDEVMYACLAGYETACRHLLLPGDAA